MAPQNRTPKGVPTGGQFAAQPHAEADISLAGDEVVTAGALRDALARMPADRPLTDSTLQEALRQAAAEAERDDQGRWIPPPSYMCTSCGVHDSNHRFSACDDGEWVDTRRSEFQPRSFVHGSFAEQTRKDFPGAVSVDFNFEYLGPGKGDSKDPHIERIVLDDGTVLAPQRSAEVPMDKDLARRYQRLESILSVVLKTEPWYKFETDDGWMIDVDVRPAS